MTPQEQRIRLDFEDVDLFWSKNIQIIYGDWKSVCYIYLFGALLNFFSMAEIFILNKYLTRVYIGEKKKK